MVILSMEGVCFTKIIRIQLLVVVLQAFIHCPGFGQPDTIKEIEELLELEKYLEVIASCDELLMDDGLTAHRSRLYHLKADALYFLDELERAIDSYLISIQINEQSENPNLVYLQEALSHAGFCYNQLKVLDKAAGFYKRSLDMAILLGDSAEVATQTFSLGQIYSRVGDYRKGMDYLKQAYEIDVARRDTSAIGFDLVEMAGVASMMGNHKVAISNLRESILFLEKSDGNPNSMAIRLGLLGNTFTKMGVPDSAYHYLEASLKEFASINDSVNMVNRWIDLAGLKNLVGLYDEAIRWAQLARDFHLSFSESNHWIRANLELTEAHIGLREYRKALDLINQNLNAPSIPHLLPELKATYNYQYEVAQALGMNVLAQESLRSFRILEDSSINMANQRAILEMEMKYAVDKAERENEILRLENEVARAEIDQQEIRFKWTVVLAVTIIIALIVITITLYSRYKIKRRLLMAEIDQLRWQLKALLEGDIESLTLDKDRLNDSLPQPLSEREFEILNYAISNLSNSEIAEKVFVSVNTVKFHLKNVYEKLGVGNRKEALQYAFRTGGD